MYSSVCAGEQPVRGVLSCLSRHVLLQSELDTKKGLQTSEHLHLPSTSACGALKGPLACSQGCCLCLQLL